MKILIILLTINLYVFGSIDRMAGREVSFSLKKLEEIASQLPPQYLVDTDSIMACPDLCPNKSIVIQYNDKHQVSHLGISMFSKETKEIINKPVCNFIERLLLELTLLRDNNEILSLLDHNNVQFQKNGRRLQKSDVNSMGEILREIEEPAYFTLSKDDKDYTVGWKYGQQNQLIIQFPLNRELITGANRIESDNALFDQLLVDNPCKSTSDVKTILSSRTGLVSNDEQIFIAKGDTFMLGIINDNKYYKKTTGGYELIYDENFPKESLSNLFLGNFDDNNLKIKVKHSMYGNFNPEYEMNLNDFICFFKNDFRIFTASIQKEPGVIHSTIVFQNRQYNYIHLLTIITQKETIFKKNGVIFASFRSNIPQHNINSLFGDIVSN
ncbi:MAG: hypothetical protein LBE79_06505 [Tannerella sp.]|jgi:hypothetical protein|nr:hypothetical protein [Tannerella sp.]